MDALLHWLRPHWLLRELRLGLDAVPTGSHRFPQTDIQPVGVLQAHLQPNRLVSFQFDIFCFLVL